MSRGLFVTRRKPASPAKAPPWTGPREDDLDADGALVTQVPPERWPNGPPDTHKPYCRMFTDGLDCDCDWGVTAPIEGAGGLEKLHLMPVFGSWLGGATLVIEEGRCSGHCCRSFRLPFTVEQLEEARQALARGIGVDDGEWPLASVRGGRDLELPQVVEMVIWIGDTFEVPGGLRMRYQDDGFYTCKHHDAATGNCGNYAQRPAMCRDFPYERMGGCPYVDCTRKATREWYDYIGPPLEEETALLKGYDGSDIEVDDGSGGDSAEGGFV